MRCASDSRRPGTERRVVLGELDEVRDAESQCLDRLDRLHGGRTRQAVDQCELTEGCGCLHRDEEHLVALLRGEEDLHEAFQKYVDASSVVSLSEDQFALLVATLDPLGREIAQRIFVEMSE